MTDGGPKSKQRFRRVFVVLVILILGAILVGVLLLESFRTTGLERDFGLTCRTLDQYTAYDCLITGPTMGVDFTQVSVHVYDASMNIIGQWVKPIKFLPSGILNLSNPVFPLGESSRISDYGETGFGMGDMIRLLAAPGGQLHDLTLVVEGGGGGGRTKVA